MKNWKVGWMTIATITMIVGCGGNGGNSNATKNTGTYIDSPVENIDYACGKIEGTTDKDGVFHFETGSGCNFSVGTIPVRQIKSDDLYPNIRQVEDNLTIAKFLMTLDNDGNASNGIEITDDVKKALEMGGIKTIPSDGNMTNIYKVLIDADIGYKGEIIDDAIAKKHLGETHISILKGLLTGMTFYGVGYSEEYEGEKEYTLTELRFNEAVTKSVWKILKSSESEDVGETGSDKINVISDVINGIIVAQLQLTDYDEEEYTKVLNYAGGSNDYIKFTSPDSCIWFYVDKTKAEAAYKKMSGEESK
jgi:hypothetical protein